MADPTTRKRRVTYLLLPAIVAAVLVLGAFLYRASRQIEQVRKLSVIEATLSLANEKADRLDRMIIEQDNAIASLVDVSVPHEVAQKWLPTATRETPTVRAVLVVDLSSRDGQVLGFASRSPGPEDEAFRRLVVHKLRADLQLNRAPADELRHLHKTYGAQSYLVSYWQRSLAGRRFLIVAWHDVARLVHDVFPRLFADQSGKARVAVADEEGRPVFGSSVRAGELTVGRPFPTTLYGWRISVTLTSADELGERIERRRTLELVLVAIACVVLIVGVGFVLIAVEQERRLSAQKSEFVANVSHELKTPLSLVRMFAELLLSGRVASEEKRRQYLEIMLVESERLTALIENVLDFARVDRGKATFDFVPAELSEVVQRAVDVYRYRAEREGLEIEVVGAELPQVRLDPRAIELCLINLLDNAIKYARGGGLVTVRVAREGELAALSVEDHGGGISAEDQRRIFDRFFRGRDARDARIRGTGIGLSLVKHIAEAHGGAVRVDSEPGRGARFTITLPLWRGPLPASAERAPG